MPRYCIRRDARVLAATVCIAVVGAYLGACDVLFVDVRPGGTCEGTLPVSCGVECCPTGEAGFSNVCCDDGTCMQDGACEDDPGGNEQVGSMVVVPEGPFFMGCNPMKDSFCDDNEKPQHEVWLAAFEIDVREVTVIDYAACRVALGCEEPSSGGECTFGVAGMEQHPINCVTWKQADAYCDLNGKRLCTEAEWEKAARGGCELYDDCATSMPEFPWGEDEASCGLAQMDGCLGATAAVGAHPFGEGPYRTLDMAGNVWEWVSDRFGPYEEGLQTNPTGPTDGDLRVRRGGAYDLDATYMRASNRAAYDPQASSTTIGFRCCR